MSKPPRLRRQPGWETALTDFLKAAAARPFSWGEHDCLLFAADWVRRMTGVDCAAPHRGKYKTARGAAGVLRRMGVADAADVPDMFAPRHEVPALARRGDIVAVPAGADGELCVGVVDDSGVHVAVVSPEGLTRYPLERAAVSWRIG